LKGLRYGKDAAMAETIIGSTIVIDGELKSGEDISILGTVKGKIQTTADLFVEAGGQVEAEVETKSIEIEGTVSGNVRASDRYEVKKSGRVEGDVRAPRLVIADGAKFKGSIDMEEGVARAPENPKPSGKPGKR
jgi:cytoskeletal protein CcmA (bactofilin family)